MGADVSSTETLPSADGTLASESEALSLRSPKKSLVDSSPEQGRLRCDSCEDDCAVSSDAPAAFLLAKGARRRGALDTRSVTFESTPEPARKAASSASTTTPDSSPQSSPTSLGSLSRTQMSTKSPLPGLLGSMTSPPSSPLMRKPGRKNTAGVMDLLQRGISLEQLLKLFCELSAQNRISGDSSTADFVRDVAIPETASEVCSLSNSTFMKIRGGRHRPQKLVSDSWGAKWRNTIISILVDYGISGGPEEWQDMLRRGDMSIESLLEGCAQQLSTSAVWLSAFSVNHHSSICGGELFPCRCSSPKYGRGHLCCQTDKYAQLTTSMPGGIVLVVDDEDPTALSRVWCLADSLQASSMGADHAHDDSFAIAKTQKPCESSEEELDKRKKENAYFVDEWMSQLQDIASTLGPELFSKEVKKMHALKGIKLVNDVL